MKKSIALAIAWLFAGLLAATAQVAINNDGNLPDSSAMLDVQSTSKGVLIPRMTKAQRYAITAPHTGLLVYQTNSPEGFYYYSDSAWVKIEKPCGESIYIASEWMSHDEEGQIVVHAGLNYHTKLFGSQCWMTENLADGYYGGYIYGGDWSNYPIYGRLYTWNQAMRGSTVEGARGVCPEGWHIPTNEDWAILCSFLDSYQGNVSGWGATGERGVDAGIKIKSMEMYGDTPLYWDTPLSYPYFKDDLSGFNAKGGGWYNPSGNNYQDLKTAAYFWTSSSTGGVYAYGRRIMDNYGSILKDSYFKTRGYSVRCIKN
jgi:uncharacterized protein (TIGR02145 family)